MMYKQCKDLTGRIANVVCRLSDNAFIPFDPANTDYAEYLAWLSSGNVPLPPDGVAGTLTPTQEN